MYDNKTKKEMSFYIWDELVTLPVVSEVKALGKVIYEFSSPKIGTLHVPEWKIQVPKIEVSRIPIYVKDQTGADYILIPQ